MPDGVHVGVWLSFAGLGNQAGWSSAHFLFGIIGQCQLSCNAENLHGNIAKHCNLIVSRIVCKAFDN